MGGLQALITITQIIFGEGALGVGTPQPGRGVCGGAGLAPPINANAQAAHALHVLLLGRKTPG